MNQSLLIVALISMLIFPACARDARDAWVASENLSVAADNFQIDRRIIFYNGITGEYMLVIRGKCAIEDQGKQLEVTCKVGEAEYKKHFLGLSDNVTYFAEQMAGSNVSTYHYNVIFKPQSILPDIDYQGSASSLGDALTPDGSD